MDRVRERIDACLAEPIVAAHPDVHRHLDNRTVYDICAHPEIVDRVASILGPDLVVWHSRVFHKRHDEPPIRWHQDGVYWSLEPLVSVSAWIAIDAAERANACVEVIPGSHLRRLPHVRTSTAGRFGHQADPDHVDASTAVAIELEPGEFFLFDTWVLHSSVANTSGRRRTALSVRYTTPDVTVAANTLSPSVSGYGVQLVRGQLRDSKNRVAPPPDPG
ncbi:MAG: Phytanoyl-CoA dioxygenase [Actinomycetia bacterium]|nr:Phytanoyl-CoA dioxygenase [Actinomycetes bacterium]